MESTSVKSKPKPGKCGRGKKRSHDDVEEPELFTPDNLPKRKPSTENEEPTLPVLNFEEGDLEPNQQEIASTLEGQLQQQQQQQHEQLDQETHEEEEDPEREDVCPENRKIYPPEPKNWQGSLPEDSCE